MKVFPRSTWTAFVPRPVTLGDEFIDLNYFDTPPVGIEFCRPNEPIMFSFRNPLLELERIRNQSVSGTGLSDVDYHYAISSVTAGVYVLRGGITKCIKSEKIRVLMLIGTDEPPTDVLKANQEAFINEEVANPFPTFPLSPGESNIHVFDLIELLAEKGLYEARNDGIYGPLCEHAVQKLQKELGLLRLNGRYDMFTINALYKLQRQLLPVGS